MKKIFILLTIALFANAGEIDNLIRGADSGPMRSLAGILLKSSPLDFNVQAFDVLLETRGKSAAIKAQNFIKDHPMDPVSTWMLLVLADYYSVEGKVNTAANLLSKAVVRDEVIVNDIYYRMIRSRLDGVLITSPGIKRSNRNSMLMLDLSEAKEIADKKGLLPDNEPDLPGVALLNLKPTSKSSIEQGKFHLQVGAFSEQANTKRIINKFRNKSYPVIVREKRSGNRTVYLVWVGNYNNREMANEEGAKIERILNIKSFVVRDP